LNQDLHSNEIPQFYFPFGKPLDSITESSYKSSINAIIADKTDIPHDLLKNLVVDVLGLPNYFSLLILLRCTNTIDAVKITRVEFNKIWK
jgi:hypothetical protein